MLYLKNNNYNNRKVFAIGKRTADYAALNYDGEILYPSSPDMHEIAELLKKNILIPFEHVPTYKKQKIKKKYSYKVLGSRNQIDQEWFYCPRFSGGRINQAGVCRFHAGIL